MNEHYLTEDSILPILEMPTPCDIRIDIYDDHIQLTVGPRDFTWKRGVPDLESAGTMMDGAQ